MKAWLEIRRNSDGITRKHPNSWEWSSDFIWKEGNFACDCNRQDFFAQAGGEPDNDNAECSYSLYSVRLSNENGNELYADDDWHEYGL